jgi:hypothetical protein
METWQIILLIFFIFTVFVMIPLVLFFTLFYKSTPTSASTAPAQSSTALPSCCSDSTIKDFTKCIPCSPPVCKNVGASNLRPVSAPGPNDNYSIVGCLSYGGVYSSNVCFDSRAYNISGYDTYTQRCLASCGQNYSWKDKPLCG